MPIPSLAALKLNSCAPTGAFDEESVNDLERQILRHLSSGAKVWERPVTDAIIAWFDESSAMSTRTATQDADAPFDALYDRLVKDEELPLPDKLAKALQYSSEPQRTNQKCSGC